MSKHNRVSNKEQIRRNRQHNAAKFERWCDRVGQPRTEGALLLYRMLGGKRYRSSKPRVKAY